MILYTLYAVLYAALGMALARVIAEWRWKRWGVGKYESGKARKPTDALDVYVGTGFAIVLFWPVVLAVLLGVGSLVLTIVGLWKIFSHVLVPQPLAAEANKSKTP